MSLSIQMEETKTLVDISKITKAIETASELMAPFAADSSGVMSIVHAIASETLYERLKTSVVQKLSYLKTNELMHVVELTRKQDEQKDQAPAGTSNQQSV